MSNSSYHHGDLKEALVQAARQIIRDKGADALSLRVIAAEVGVSHMAPYAHFKSKKDLLQSVAASGFAELADRMQRNSQDLCQPDQLALAYGVTYIEFAVDQPQLYRLMLGQVETVGRRAKVPAGGDIEVTIARAGVSPELEASSKRPFDLLHAAFKRMRRDERRALAQAIGAWSMVHGMAALLIEGHVAIPESLSLKEFLAMAVIQAV